MESETTRKVIAFVVGIPAYNSLSRKYCIVKSNRTRPFHLQWNSISKIYDIFSGDFHFLMFQITCTCSCISKCSELMHTLLKLCTRFICFKYVVWELSEFAPNKSQYLPRRRKIGEKFYSSSYRTKTWMFSTGRLWCYTLLLRWEAKMWLGKLSTHTPRYLALIITNYFHRVFEAG